MRACGTRPPVPGARAGADAGAGLAAAEDDARREVSTCRGGGLDIARRALPDPPPRDEEPEPGRSPVALAWMKSSSVMVSKRYWGCWGVREAGST